MYTADKYMQFSISMRRIYEQMSQHGLKHVLLARFVELQTTRVASCRPHPLTKIVYSHTVIDCSCLVRVTNLSPENDILT